MQAKDIPEQPILDFLANLPQPATWFPGYPNSIQNAMPEGTPDKVALAKMSSMVRRGLIKGCSCGCRGDFVLWNS